MKNLVKDTIHANGIDIGIYTQDFENEFISLTDIARYKSDEPKDVIKNWMRSKDTIEFLGLWEKLHNSNFKGVEFDSFRNQAGSNAFTMSPTKWIETTGAIGIVSKSGRYGGTFAHSDIAFEFASWIIDYHRSQEHISQAPKWRIEFTASQQKNAKWFFDDISQR